MQQQSCPSIAPFCSSPSPAIATTDELQAKEDEVQRLKAVNADLVEQTLRNLNPNTNLH